MESRPESLDGLVLDSKNWSHEALVVWENGLCHEKIEMM